MSTDQRAAAVWGLLWPSRSSRSTVAQSILTASLGSARSSACACRAPVPPKSLKVISAESRDGITVLRLNRPDGHNALVPAFLERLVEHLQHAGATGQPVVLTAPRSTFH